MRPVHSSTTALVHEHDPLDTFAGAQLVVLFADGQELRPARTRGAGSIRLSSGFSVSEDDTYLVLPDDIGEELVDIFRDGDQELLEEVLEEGLLVQGEVCRGPGGAPTLAASFAATVDDALREGLPYAADIDVRGAGADLTGVLQRLNTLPHVQCTMVSTLLDAEGLDQVLSRSSHLGASWRPPEGAPGLSHLPPTFLWSRRTGPGQVGLELALFVEDDDLTALMRPARLAV